MFCLKLPTIIRDALPKSGKTNLGEDLYKVLTVELNSSRKMLSSLNLKTDHSALEVINKLEAAVFVWKERISEQASHKSPVRTSWSFIKDPISEREKTEFLLERAEALIQQLKTRYPNLPRTFLDATKIQYGKDVGHSILEAYSRVLTNLTFSILSRIGDILQEDALSNPNSPVAKSSIPGSKMNDNVTMHQMSWPRLCSGHSLTDQMNKADGKYFASDASTCSASETSTSEAKASSVNSTPSVNSVWCVSKEVV